MAREGETLEEFCKRMDADLAKHKRVPFEQQQAKRAADQAHIDAAIAAKIDPELKAADASRAKAYSRARSFPMLRHAYDTLEAALRDPNCKQATKISVALSVIQRAVGPAEIPNGINADLTTMAPVDIIDLVLQEHANGNVTKEFVATVLGLLAAKVQGLKIEDVIISAKQKRASKTT